LGIGDWELGTRDWELGIGEFCKNKKKEKASLFPAL
jgi:hypothetical protein